MKRGLRRMFAGLLSIALALSLGVQALADFPADMREGVEGEYAGKTVILHSNDVHGEIMGYAYIAALKTEFQSKGADVILADAGDFSQGDPNVSVSKGADAVAMMNAAGYDVATLGNHEFDYGYETLQENIQNAEFHVVCADIFKDGANIAPASSWTYEKDGLKIGFFGLTTPQTKTSVNPSLVSGIDFPANKDGLFACAQEQIDALRNDGADIVIALSHCGVDISSEANEFRSLDVYRHTQGLDLMIDGHSHTVMTAGEKGEPIQSTGTKFANVGVVVIDNAKEAIEDHYLIPTKVYEKVTGEDGKEEEKLVSELPKDATVAKNAQDIMDSVNAVYGQVFARSEIFLNGERAPGNRTEETNLGDLVIDAMVWKALQEEGSLTVDEGHVVGVTNGGGVRASIQSGDITRKDLNTTLPFGNTVSVIYVTGAELLEALEASTYATPNPSGAYPQTFGIEFTLDTTKPYDQGETYPDSTYYKPASIQRVTITKINEQPFDPAATYAVVTNNFCAAGGDTYYIFKNATAQFDTGVPMDEALMEYVDVNLKNVISAETYGTPRGDQTIILPPQHSVTVTGGSGSGEYYENVTVTVTADEPESGKRFKEWTGAENLDFTDGSATTQSATFAMPTGDVTLTAIYEDIPSNDGQAGTSGESRKGWCYVATAVYGSYDCPEVWTLRRFRDNVLAETWYGRLFVRAYYAVSPTAVKLFGESEWFRNFFRERLDRMVSDLQASGFESTPYEDTDW